MGQWVDSMSSIDELNRIELIFGEVLETICVSIKSIYRDKLIIIYANMSGIIF